MNKVQKLSGLLIALALLVPALAQEAAETEPFDPELYEPLGDVEVGVYEPYEAVDAELGAIVLSATTPTDQHPNYDVVGPDAYHEHFDISDDPGAERVLEGLLPGVYSIASSDEGLQLSATVVEVRAGEVVPVHFNLVPMEDAAYDIADYTPYAYPAGDEPWGVGYTPYDNPEFGSVTITSEEGIDTEVVVTGPNGYSVDFEGSATLDDLLPGTYVVASTDEGYDLSRNVFEVRVGERVELTPTTGAADAAEAVDPEPEAAGAGVAVAGTGLFGTFDTDASGDISEAEFGAGFYDTIDADSDGIVTAEEYEPYESRFGYSYDELDTDANGEVTEEEFLGIF